MAAYVSDADGYSAWILFGVYTQCVGYWMKSYNSGWWMLDDGYA
jgi:hypothetical protein